MPEFRFLSYNKKKGGVQFDLSTRKSRGLCPQVGVFAQSGLLYFDDLGGDCTNFISQCLFAGAGVMNYTRETGWYYSSASNRAAAWTGVEFLFRFLTNNQGPGPFAEELPLSHAAAGDVIQLSFDGAVFSHSLLIVEESGLLVATHTQDADYRPLSTYSFVRSRLLHIEGVRR